MPGVDRDRWRRLSPYLDDALELSTVERDAWLAALHAQNPELSDELRALLLEHDALDGAGFLDDERARPETFAAPLVGQRVGAYTLTEPVGEGGTGTVWLARRSDGRFEGIAAVKLLNASLLGHASEVRFRREG